MLVRQRVEAVADTAEVLSFVQNFACRHGLPDFAMHNQNRATRTPYRVRRIPRARPGDEGGRQPALFKEHGTWWIPEARNIRSGLFRRSAAELANVRERTKGLCVLPLFRLALHEGIAVASRIFQPWPVDNLDAPAPGVDQPRLMQHSRRDRHTGATSSQHLSD
jgi:hypothetical protein